MILTNGSFTNNVTRYSNCQRYLVNDTQKIPVTSKVQIIGNIGVIDRVLDLVSSISYLENTYSQLMPYTRTVVWSTHWYYFRVYFRFHSSYFFSYPSSHCILNLSYFTLLNVLHLLFPVSLLTIFNELETSCQGLKILLSLSPGSVSTKGNGQTRERIATSVRVTDGVVKGFYGPCEDGV